MPGTNARKPSRRRPGCFRIGLAIFAVILLIGGSLAGTCWWYFHPDCERESGIVYGTRHGRELTFDVLKPGDSNGRGILFMVSGGWKSKPDAIRPWLVAALIRRGYTVFPVCHVSQPEATVMETVDDIQRAVRFIRSHADRWGIDPGRLGTSGGSSGGHLSLMLATRGGPGDPTASDPVDRESSAVQAVAVFFPVTDLLNLGDSTQNPGDGGPPIDFVEAFGPGADDLPTWKKIGRGVSPIYHITTDLPPVLIHHGDADKLVPPDQSTRFAERAVEDGAKNVEVVIRRGKRHGWIGMVFRDLRDFADWYDRWLAAE